MNECPTQSDLEHYCRDELARDQVDLVERHLKSCERCASVCRDLTEDGRFLDKLKDALDLDQTLSSANRREPPGELTNTNRALNPESPAFTEQPAREVLPRIEGYAIKGVIGRGGMGVVYEAFQEKLKRPVAVKLLPAVASSAHPDLVTRFQREATAAARLHHSNIVPIYDFGESPDGYYYAMELLEGIPVNKLIKRLADIDAPHASHTAIAALISQSGIRPQDEIAEHAPAPGSGGGTSGSRMRPYYRQVAHWIADVAEALHHAHLHAMVHRDIKPGNLMLCTDGRMMTLDFGLVKTIGDQSVTATGSLVGTYRYMSPEQVGAKRITVDARTDVYSLGATLYELLTFQPPFPATEQSELLSQILFKEPTPPRRVFSGVPVDLQTICLKALEKDPSQRYRSAREFADDLNFFLQDQNIVARPQSLLRRAAKLVRRRRVETIALTAMLLLIAALAMWTSTSRRLQESTRQQQEARVNDLINQAVQAHWSEGDSAKAVQAFEEALRLEPGNYRALINLAIVLKDQYVFDGQDASLIETAQELLNRAETLKPGGKEIWNVRGAIHQYAGRTEQAIEAFRQVCEIDESFYPAWVNLGMLYASQGDMEQAEQCAIEGARLSENAENTAAAVMPWRCLAAVQMHLKRSDALAALRKALDASNNQDAAALAMLARDHMRLGESEGLQAALELAATANNLASSGRDQELSDNTETLSRVKRALARARLLNRQWSRAIEAAHQALEAGDDAAYANLIIALASANIGDFVRAQASLAAAEAAWPPQFENASFFVTNDGRTLWFDYREEYEQLRANARAILDSAP